MRRRRAVLIAVSLLLLSGCFSSDVPVDPTLFTEQLFNGTTIPGWWTGTDGGKQAWHEDSAYHVGLTTGDTTYWTRYTVPGRIGDFQLDIDIAQIEGPNDNGFGVVFRNYCYNNYYYFLISGDGYMTFRKVVDGHRTDIQSWTQCAAVTQGNATNHLTIIADGSQFRFFVNDTEVLQATDSALATGYLGVMVKSYGVPGVHVAFDNLRVHWVGEEPVDRIFIRDLFLSESEHWNTTDNETWTSYVADDEYHIEVKTTGAAVERYQGPQSTFSNFSFHFEVRVVEGAAENPYGLLFRMDTASGKAAYYRFLMLDDGRAKLEKRISGTTTTLVDWIECPWVVPGEAHMIQLTADCKRITVSIDYEHVIDVVDDSLGLGEIALVVFNLSEDAGFHVAYDQVSLFYYEGE